MSAPFGNARCERESPQGANVNGLQSRSTIPCRTEPCSDRQTLQSATISLYLKRLWAQGFNPNFAINPPILPARLSALSSKVSLNLDGGTNGIARQRACEFRTKNQGEACLPWQWRS